MGLVTGVFGLGIVCARFCHHVPLHYLHAKICQRFQGLMKELVARARELFARGRPLCDRVGRELRFELRLTWLGGSRILDGIEAAGHDVFARRPQHGLLDKLALAWSAWRWRRAAA